MSLSCLPCWTPWAGRHSDFNSAIEELARLSSLPPEGYAVIHPVSIRANLIYTTGPYVIWFDSGWPGRGTINVCVSLQK